MNKSSKARFWVTAILLGLAGQLAWAIENQYINLWVYGQSGQASHITWMTTASAIVATLTTFLMGTLSDRLGKRKIFISLGYTIWGVFVFAFGLVSLTNMEKLSGGDMAKAVLLVGILNTVVDSVMTFFGSTANDAAFNSWITDETDTHNRPLVESVLSIMPLFAMGLMLLMGMAFGVPGSQKEGESVAEFAARVAPNWLYFFLAAGIFTTLVGVACFFLMKKDHIAPNRDKAYMKELVYGFTPKAMKGNPDFYIALLAFLFFNIAVDSFMPYYLVYFTNSIKLENFYPAMGVIIGFSSIVAVALGAAMDKIGKYKLLIPAILIMAIAAVVLFLVQSSWWGIVIAASAMMSGYLVGTTVLGASVRDETPLEKVGALQGVRMVFAVMLPMVLGSNISLAVFQTTYVNDFGETVGAPDKWMFLVTAVACLLAIGPSLWLILRKKKALKSTPKTSDLDVKGE